MIDPEEPVAADRDRPRLEEDAGKLLHGRFGGGAIAGSIVDLNAPGTPLLEIVTQPDFRSSDTLVTILALLRNICRFLGVSEGVMQKGQMRFEPNINTELRLAGGGWWHAGGRDQEPQLVPRAQGAIDHEHAEQPGRWHADGRVMGKGMKTTRGWDDARRDPRAARRRTPRTTATSPTRTCRRSRWTRRGAAGAGALPNSRWRG